MNKKSSPIARILAVVALIAAVVVVFSVVTGSTGSDDDPAKKNNRASKQNKQGGNKKTPKTYEVQPDDTLTGIASENGVSVERIQELNPELDPQALQAGQKLKLR